MGKSPGINDESRRGTGSSMATMMAAQLWAMDHDVVVVLDSPPSQVVKWRASLHPSVQQRLRVIHARTLEEVDNHLRGTRFSKVFVDHAIIERSEDTLERRIQALRDEHTRLLHAKETIR